MLDDKDLQAIATMMEAQENRFSSMMDTKLEAAKKEINEQTARNLRIIVEAEINPKFELVMEGYENLLQPLSPKSKVDELEEEVVFLRGIVNNLMLDVAALKKNK